MSLTVLVVDDSAVMRKIVSRTLRASGLTISTLLEAASGEEALTIIKGGTRPNLIVSDINMSGMSGIDFVREARKTLSQRETKVVMITTESGSDKVHAAMSAGANAYLTKPFTPDQVATALQDLL